MKLYLEKRNLTRIMPVTFMAIFFGFSACSELSPLAPAVEQQGDGLFAVTKTTVQGDTTGRKPVAGSKTRVLKLKSSKTFVYSPEDGFYKGGTLKVAGYGSNFHVFDNSLIPPPGIRFADDVVITMVVDYDAEKHELRFTFGPSGCRFEQPARIKLDYRVLGVDVAKLFYIDKNGDYVEQQPDNIDTKHRFMTINIKHFSRYAVAWAR